MSEGGKSQDALDRWRAQSGQEDGKGDDEKTDKDTEPRKRRFYQSIWFKIAIVLIVIALIVGGILWWLDARQYEDTDDAFIDTHIVHIAPQIAGQIIDLKVNDNQLVQQGQLLAEISPKDTQAKLAQVQAQGLQAETQYEQMLANQAAALASRRGAEAQATNTASDLARYLSLQKTNPQAVAQQQVDQAVATDRNARAQASNAAAQVAAAAAQVAGAKAQIKTAEAELATAEINLSYTKIYAPETGHVTQRSVALGNYVTPGQDLMTIVPLHLWVTANFKETQLALMRPGQPATVVADACGDADIRGHVDSVQRGAGQAFGILPPENATGNYVKVVQRVPVKILLDQIPKDCTLGPGMSVEPTVKVR
jgi:membrane fusion protein (multidrug efflux system)